MFGGLIAVLLQILHERRSARAYGMRIFLIRLSLSENVRRSEFKVQRSEPFNRFHAGIVDFDELCAAGTLHE